MPMVACVVQRGVAYDWSERQNWLRHTEHIDRVGLCKLGHVPQRLILAIDGSNVTWSAFVGVPMAL